MGLSNPVPTRSFVLYQEPLRAVTTPLPTCRQTVTRAREPDNQAHNTENLRAVPLMVTVRDAQGAREPPNADFRAATSAPLCLDWVLLLPVVLPRLRSFFQGRYRRRTWPGCRSLP